MTICRKNKEPVIRAGYTFLELAITLGLIAIVFAAAFPAVSASYLEKRLRGTMDAIGQQVRESCHQAEASGQEQNFVIARRGLAVGTDKDKALAVSVPEGMTFELKFPHGEWELANGQPWQIFSTGFVQPLSLRLRQDSAWIETDFDVLTGGIAAERYSF